jgi:hypothetical protein
MDRAPVDGENKTKEPGAAPRLSPPTQDEVSYRALCLRALQFRAVFEYAYRGNPDPDGELRADLRKRLVALNAWVSVEGIDLHASATEGALLAKALGTWVEQELRDASWRNEAYGTVLWALGQIPVIPPYDQQFEDTDQCIEWLEPATEVLARMRLRPAAEIARARKVAELWNWRARTTRLQHQQWRLAKRHNLPAVIRRAAHLAHEHGDLPPPMKDDFPAFGKPYARLSSKEHSEAESIATERHFALNWLCGYSEDWDSTPTDT